MKNKNRRIMRRALSVILALLMLLTVTPLTVFAEETETATATKTFETGDIIEFGSYPQSEVTDETLKAELTAKAGSTDGWTSYDYYIISKQSDYMKYIDIEYDGAKYRGVYFTQYRPCWTNSSSGSYQDDNGYSTSTIYWFKYEPMKWQVLSYDSTTGEAVVLSKNIIDSQQYYNNLSNRTIDGKTVYANNYEHSDIRAWLNDTFYNTAFGTSEKNAIVATTLDNSGYNSTYNSNSTTDNVWLLSYSEAQKTAYGFTSDTGDTETRQATGTAYALSQGLYKYTSNSCTYWYLRSAGSRYHSACGVNYGGSVSDSIGVFGVNLGVRPALTLNLTSEISPSCEHTWQTTVTSPTCTEGGYTTYCCTKCSQSYNGDSTDPLGHDMKKTEAVKETCTEDGNVEYYTCTRCKKIFNDEAGSEETTLDDTAIKAHHLLAEHPASEPTCTTDGNNAYVDCHREGCGYTTFEVIPALGHDFELIAETAATCTEDGEKSYKCTRCDETKTEKVDALGHDFKLIAETAATCTKDGEKSYKCKNCTATKTEKIPANGHRWGEWVTVKEPTTTEEGLAKRICSACKTEEEKTLGRVSEKNRTIQFVNIDKMYYVLDNDGEDYIVYNSGAVKWYSDKPLNFTVYTYSNFKYQTVIVKVNGVEISPNADAVYTVPAGTDLVAVTVEGAVENSDGTKLSFWEVLIRFFKKLFSAIAELFGK